MSLEYGRVFLGGADRSDSRVDGHISQNGAESMNTGMKCTHWGSAFLVSFVPMVQEVFVEVNDRQITDEGVVFRVAMRLTAGARDSGSC